MPVTNYIWIMMGHRIWYTGERWEGDRWRWTETDGDRWRGGKNTEGDGEE